MSGIVGIVQLNGSPVDRTLLRRLVDLMAFRGPDAQGTWQNGQVVLGHALLRTSFESEHEQGPCSLDGQVWIAADARVDGRQALLQELRNAGRTASTDDPDVLLILHAYHAWGEQCLAHLIGDFAFVLWDGRRQRLLCAHDQLGITPFFYAQVDHCLVLSNTLQAVLGHPGVSDELNEAAIGDYLLFRHNRDDHTTTFRDIHRLPPATALSWTVGDSAPRLWRYWTMPEGRGYAHYRDPEEYVTRFRELFQQAVEDRLRTDRVSVAMSGGLDSPAVAAVGWQALQAQGGNPELQAFTMTHTLIPHEEARYAHLVGEAAGFPVHELDQDARLLQQQAADSAVSPEPSFVFSWAWNPWGELWHRAAGCSRVLLTGHGGDPLLRMTYSYWLQLLARGQWGQMIGEMGQYQHRYGRRAPLYVRASLREWHRRRQPMWRYPTWLNPDFAARLHLEDRQAQEARRQKYSTGVESLTRDSFWLGIPNSFDPSNTCLPLKARFPFLDLRLLEFAATVPPVPWFEGKRLLRESMHGVLPDAVRQRPKTAQAGLSFDVLVQTQGIPDVVTALAGAPELAPYVEREALLQALRPAGGPAGFAARFVIPPLTLAHWLRHRRSQAPTGRKEGGGD